MTDIFDSFILRALLAGIGMAVATAPLGCFVVWRRMAYFGDATAHAAILGVALSLAFSLPVTLGVLLVAVIMAASVTWLNEQGHGTDTALGVLAHSALAFGLIAAALTDSIRIDLMAYLIGDILSVSTADLALIWLGALFVCGLIYWRWPALLLSTINPELACSSGMNPGREKLTVTIALALTVAVAIKIVGVLLIAAMLVIPPACVRPLSRTPEAMALFAAVAGVLAVCGGFYLSLNADTPTGPSIIMVAAFLFMTVTGAAALAGLRRGG